MLSRSMSYRFYRLFHILFCRLLRTLILSGLLLAMTNARATTFDLEMGLQIRGFTEDSPRQSHDVSAAVRIQGEWFYEWNEGDDFIEFVPWIILDSQDRERRHGDIRDLAWVHIGDDWELRTGIRKVFWGVTESVHRVDIINQTDLAARANGEEKLGQPMINVSLVRDWGIFDIFLMTGHRERIFPGHDGRFQIISNPIFWDKGAYASDQEELHPEIAVRWQMSWGDFEGALSHFSGTSREPAFYKVYNDGVLLGSRPYYTTIDQTGLEMLYIWDSWIFKGEVISVSGLGERFAALTGGFEFTQNNILDTVYDLGWIVEVSLDERGDDAESVYEHDVFLGIRLGFNDEDSSEMLLGINVDYETREQLYVLEFKRRISESMTLSLDALVVAGSAPPPAFGASDDEFKAAPISKDDYLQAEFTYYF